MHDPDPQSVPDPDLEPDLEDELDAVPDGLASGGAAPLRTWNFVVDGSANGLRLDKYLAVQLPEMSRSRLQKWIELDAVRLNGVAARARASVYAYDEVQVHEQVAPDATAYEAQEMPLTVVWEDETLIVIDKPAGLVVHPGAGNWSGTLLNGLLAYDPRLAAVPRAGIVHRLDAGTSGLMVVARTVAAQFDLVRQLQARTVAREYWALVAGSVAPTLTIDAALARDPRNPLRFRVSRSATARPARTFVRRLAEWKQGEGPACVSWVACRLDTGRTHQIRVHLESQEHPLLGDPVYRLHMPASLRARDAAIARQALHACRLELEHPGTREPMGWSSAPPADMLGLMRALGARPAQLRPPAKMSIVRPGAGERQPDEDGDDDSAHYDNEENG